MIRSVRPVVVVLFLLSLPLAAGAQPSANKEAAVASVEKHRAELVDLSDQIWRFTAPDSPNDPSDQAARQGTLARTRSKAAGSSGKGFQVVLRHQGGHRSTSARTYDIRFHYGRRPGSPPLSTLQRNDGFPLNNAHPLASQYPRNSEAYRRLQHGSGIRYRYM